MSEQSGLCRLVLRQTADWYSSRHHACSHSDATPVSLRASRHVSCARGVSLS